MLRFSEIVFGPIYSRRLGSSLGINLLPSNGKLCNFDCIYCECGWNSDGRSSEAMPDYTVFAEALESKLKKCAEDSVGIDSITFSGNGEPTLNPDFPQIVDITLALRDKYYPDAVVSVLSNASRLSDESVLNALMKVDNPILKLDAVDLKGAELINKPQFDWNPETIIAGMKKFEGNFVLQTMFLASDDYDTASIMDRWMQIVRELKPRKIMAYSLDRETPQKSLRKYQKDEISQMLKALIDEGFDIQINA